MKSWVVRTLALVAFCATCGCKPARRNDPVSDPEVASTAPVASVVLFADLSEAATSCGCGEIIRAVLDARAKGVATTEIDTRKDDKAGLLARHKVLVAPAVLFLDAGGREVRRYEGESSDVIRNLKADLGKIEVKAP